MIDKSIELLQEREDTFINLVLNLLEEEADPYKVIRKLEKVFVEDTKDFVKSLWRFIIFEQLKLKYFNN